MRIYHLPLIGMLAHFLALSTFAEDVFPLVNNDVIVFAGSTEMVGMQRAGYLETLFTSAFAEASPTFRDLAWDADTVSFQGTVDGQWRTNGHFDDLGAFGDWNTQLKRVGATVIIAHYGAMESLEGPDGMEAFSKDLDDVLDEFARITERVILISPAPFEGALAAHNSSLRAYASIVQQAAKDRGVTYVDLTQLSVSNRTQNGWLTTPSKHAPLAEAIGNQLGMTKPDWEKLEPLRLAIVEKHRLWYDYWRPANWKCLFGDDGKRGFSKAAEGLPSFQEEWTTFPSLIAKAETQVAAVARGDSSANEWEPLPPQPRTGSSDADIAAETAAFTTPEGYEMNLFADESLGIANPLGMRWDPDGRLYVACTYVYPQIDPGAQPDDTIIILEDTDGDGRADKSTLFAEGLNIPSGIELGNGGVYVGQNTEILFLKDTDGDLRADEREVVLSGFGNGDSHQTINTFVWSPGGELFFCQGDGIESRVETPHGVSGLYGPGAFRWRPQRMELHGMLNNFMGPGNPWGIAFDDWGQAIIIDGAGGISHLTPAFLPVKRKLKLPTIGKPGGYCGIDVLASNAFPEDMRGDFVMGDYKKNQITRFSTTPDGAGFEVQFESPLLKSSHRNFRPVDVRVGPDGGVYVADFYNPIICHQDDFYRTPIRDKTHGRIWRMAPKGKKFTVPSLSQTDVPTLIDQLRSQDRWTCYQAKRILSLRDAEEVSQATISWASTQNPIAKLEALRVLETIETPNLALLQDCLTAEEPRIRAYATRVLGRWADRLPAPLTLLRSRLADDDIRVRLEAALACGMIHHPESIHHLVTLTDLPMDRWVTYAFKQAVESLKPIWLPRFKDGQLNFTNPDHLAAVFDATDSKALIRIVRGLVLNENISIIKRTGHLHSLIAQGESSDIRFAFRPEFVASTLPKVASMTREGVIDRNHPDEAADLLRPLIHHDDPNIALAAIELVGLWKKETLAETLISLIKEKQLEKAAITALGRVGGEKTEVFLAGLGKSAPSLDLRTHATAALAEVNLEQAASLAAELFSLDLAQDRGTLAKRLLQAFGSVSNGPTVLDAALKGKTIPEATARVSFEALFTQSSPDFMDLRNRFGKVIGITPAISEYDAEFIEKLIVEVNAHGDAAKGEDVFRKATVGCYACHQIHGAGGTIGPDLTAIGNTMQLYPLIHEVVWPERTVKEGYNLIQITHKDGGV
ncbi:MAG: glucose/arabinose dehydrogenase/HEAT repeat protein, partial [Verrucomicrobiales bacterium]